MLRNHNGVTAAPSSRSSSVSLLSLSLSLSVHACYYPERAEERPHLYLLSPFSHYYQHCFFSCALFNSKPRCSLLSVAVVCVYVCVCVKGGRFLSDLRCLGYRVLVDVLKSRWSIFKGGCREPPPPGWLMLLESMCSCCVYVAVSPCFGLVGEHYIHINIYKGSD